VVQASKPKLRIPRYELSEEEWVTIEPMLPPRVDPLMSARY
jgi:hypothetical protein